MHWGRISKRQADLEREIQSDLELEAEEQRESGVPPDEARSAARRAFGNDTLIREQTHEAWGWSIFERFWQDVRYAMRQLRKSPGFAFVSLLTLALGIGANTAVFSVIQAVLLGSLPYREASQLVMLTDPQDPRDGGVLLSDLATWKQRSRTVEDLSAYYRNSGWSRVTLTGSQEPVSLQGAFVSADLFLLLGVPPQLGRTFTHEEEVHRDHVVLLSYGLWQRRFGGSPDILNQTIHLDGWAFQVIGVMPRAFQFPAAESELWAPMTTSRYWADPQALIHDGQHGRGFYARWQAVARLKEGVSVQIAQAELNASLNNLEKSSPDPFRGAGIKVLPLRIQINSNTQLALYILFASVGLLLLIACSNVANLTLARGAARADELALRAALGASRHRIVRQLLIEALVMALLAAVLSVPCAVTGTHALAKFAPTSIPRLEQAGLNFRVLGFLFAVSGLCAIVFGLIPAITLTRCGSAEKMRSGNLASSESKRLIHLRSWLIIFEIAFSVVLLTCAGLLIHSFLIVRAVDPGFEAEHVLRLNASLAGGSSEWPATFYDAIVTRLQGLPGVKAVGAIDNLFDLGATNNLGLRAMEGRETEPREQWTALTWDTVRGDYFEAIGAELVGGRYFSDSDQPHSPLVAVIDESMARRYWPGENAIGKRFKGQDRRGQNDDWLTVIGVVRDMRTHGLERAATPHVYEWYRQSGNATPDILVRTAGDPSQMASSLRAAVRDVAPGAVLSDMTPVMRELQHQLAPRRFQTTLLGLFSWLALLLAALGVYGLMHYSVVQHTREIGIRMALGAARRDIVAMIFDRSFKLALAGLALGLGLDCGASRILTKLLYGVHAFDPLTLLPVCLILIGVSVLASLQPAFRAASIDPMQALRSE